MSLAHTHNTHTAFDPRVCVFGTQLQDRGDAYPVKPESLEELRAAIFLAEEAYPGITDAMVTQLIQRLQR